MGCVQSQDWAETRRIPYILLASIDQSKRDISKINSFIFRTYVNKKNLLLSDKLLISQSKHMVIRMSSFRDIVHRPSQTVIFTRRFTNLFIVYNTVHVYTMYCTYRQAHTVHSVYPQLCTNKRKILHS